MPSYNWYNLTINLFINNVYAAFTGCLVRGFLNWYADLVYKKQLEKKNIEMELALLKAQINPHFLFNTLNNIDVLIEKDPKTASVYLKKLSDILRFTLYEGPLAKTELAREVNYIEQYIELQKIRTANPNFVKFKVKGNPDNLFIAPMLFIPYIENAFKHATNKKINNAIEIDITVLDSAVEFTCSNVFNQSDTPAQPYSGLGLDLINSRLKLLYKNHHTLHITQKDHRFTVTLTVNLHDN
ncbi:sensor histidine kinase [Mucilaginibacter lappiensis]|nr:histidine kinase [Mucilaginibacter lappiensis]